ncbi:MAG TPA: hypothetical protein VEK11_10605 [Thermoanaerobaculia bacterium]|nr:hypothetical protein [Thermoanaerobaculia bacterium]
MNALYEPLIERDHETFARAARAFAESHSPDELWIAVTRFAVLAYAPSQHSKRAVMACRAAYAFRNSDVFVPLTLECARYAADSRQPWSEPPILEPPSHPAPSLEGDRVAAEAWLGQHLSDAEVTLREVVKGDARLMLDAALALEQPLGAKGRYALLRMVISELFTETDDPTESLDVLISRAIATHGAPDAVRAVFVRNAGVPPAGPVASPPPLYQLARDYAQTLIAHTISVPRYAEFLSAVHDNLEHGDNYADWSFA